MINSYELQDKDFVKYMKRLILVGALELCSQYREREVLIPYLMNDAVEQYISLKECKMIGELDAEDIEDTEIELVDYKDMKGCILRQPHHNIVNLWYKSAQMTTACYQYHRIGHAWRKEPGEEYIRRLVNLICVLHDKCYYLKKEYYSVEEEEIGLLAECSPIIYFTPINEPIIDWYPESIDGVRQLEKLADSLQLSLLTERIRKYKVLVEKGKRKYKHAQKLAEELIKPANQILWEEIAKRIYSASVLLDERDYGEEMNASIACYRQKVEKKLWQEGYRGQYPVFVNEDGDIVECVEEHPFTILEEDHYDFKIFCMKRTKNNNLESKLILQRE